MPVRPRTGIFVGMDSNSNAPPLKMRRPVRKKCGCPVRKKTPGRVMARVEINVRW